MSRERLCGWGTVSVGKGSVGVGLEQAVGTRPHITFPAC